MAALRDLPKDLRNALVRPTWVEVDLDAIEHNVKTLKRLFNRLKLIGVLKGNACGFGTAETGAAMEAAGADMLAVANPFEVTVLRRRGVTCPILLYASYIPEAASQLVSLGAIPTIISFEMAQALAEAAKSSLQKPLDVFVKIDTGIGRLGITPEQAVSLAKYISENDYLRLQGVYSHITIRASDEQCEEQARKLQLILTELAAMGIDVPVRMITSTHGILRGHYNYDWANAFDPGRLLFGIKDPPDVPFPEGGEMREALRGFRTSIIHIRNVKENDHLEYRYGESGRTARYGVLPIGWTDLFLPSDYSRSGALVRGVKVKIHRFSAEHSILDLTDVPEAKVGDIVTLLGEDGDSAISLTQFAKEAGQVASNVTRRFGRHVSFVYFRNNKPVKVCNLIGDLQLADS